MATSNAQRQALYRARHLRELDEMLLRLNLMIDLHAKRALERLASGYGVTQRSVLERLLLQAQSLALDAAAVQAPNGENEFYDCQIKLRSPFVTL